ncbi:MAG TPA: FkbM family methyltransferase [Ignavibacteriaceae bacterium]|nr:FkbM family methyltransferase [Ignavibacteriaceae bacterium]
MILKNNFLYKYLKHRENIGRIKQWSSDDDKRFEFYKEFIKPGDLVFDVGANIGNRTKIFLKLQAKVVAFEPQKICAEFLMSAFKKEKNFSLVQKALGLKEGNALMHVGDEHTISTLSADWIEATKRSGRFSKNTWDKSESVSITTLDNSIIKFGMPSFIKIDVEGYEYEVLLGISSPVDCISIEFAAENVENSFKCVDYLNSLSGMIFQFSKAEEAGFYFREWMLKDQLKRNLNELIEKDPLIWGDIYIKKIRKN